MGEVAPALSSSRDRSIDHVDDLIVGQSDEIDIAAALAPRGRTNH
jgi:hypothetical protein